MDGNERELPRWPLARRRGFSFSGMVGIGRHDAGLVGGKAGEPAFGLFHGNASARPYLYRRQLTSGELAVNGCPRHVVVTAELIEWDKTLRHGDLQFGIPGDPSAACSPAVCTPFHLFRPNGAQFASKRACKVISRQAHRDVDTFRPIHDVLCVGIIDLTTPAFNVAAACKSPQVGDK